MTTLLPRYLILAEKLKVKRQAKNQYNLVKQFEVGNTQIQLILKHEQEYLDAYKACELNSHKKRVVATNNEEIYILKWQHYTRQGNKHAC